MYMYEQNSLDQLYISLYLFIITVIHLSVHPLELIAKFFLLDQKETKQKRKKIFFSYSRQNRLPVRKFPE